MPLAKILQVVERAHASLVTTEAVSIVSMLMNVLKIPIFVIKYPRDVKIILVPTHVIALMASRLLSMAV